MADEKQKQQFLERQLGSEQNSAEQVRLALEENTQGDARDIPEQKEQDAD